MKLCKQAQAVETLLEVAKEDSQVFYNSFILLNADHMLVCIFLFQCTQIVVPVHWFIAL
jgi:hypothetical protein